jgi:hypothetical protein
MKTFPKLAIYGIVLAIVVAAAGIGFEGGTVSIDELYESQTPPKKRVEFNLDKQSAIQIAEIVFVHVYGKDVLKERPWNVSQKKGLFEISGSLPKGWDGGVATMKMNPKTAEVVELYHGK